MATFYKGETATLSGCTGFSITGLTTKKVKLLRPDATSVQYTGASVVVDDASTGQWHVVTLAADLNQAGLYLMQSYWSDGSVIRFGPVDTFRVEDPLTFT